LIRGIYTAAAGALVAQANADTIADNLANVSTAGFKRTLLQVQSGETMDLQRMQTDPSPGSGGGKSVSVPVGTLGLGSEVYATPTSFVQGSSLQTGNPFDVAINGNGFFTIQTPQGVRYTRNGAFVRDARGVLMTQDGSLVMGNSGAVALPQGDVKISADGSISVDGNLVDRLRLTQFGNMSNVSKQGGSLFADLGAQPSIDTTSTVAQGKIEQANSNVVQSMVDLITAQRWFEANQKVIQTEAQATTQAIQTVGNSKA
jgi:flagellar basal-body rod protein FlgF